MKYNKYGSTAVVVTALLWSVDGLLRRHLYTLPAPVIVFYEHSLGLLVLSPLLFFAYKGFKRLTGRQWLAIGLVALLSGAAGTILYTAALGRIQYIPFSVVVLLQQLNPIFAIATSAILLGEPITKRFFGLSAIAIVGGYITVFPHLKIDLSTGSGTLIAALMALGAAAAWGTATAFSKYALVGQSSLQITGLRYALTIPFALLFVLGSGSAHALGSITLVDFWYLVAITFSTGLLAVLIYYFGLKRVLASRSAILELTWPASAVFIGWIFLHQGLTAVQVIASLVMLATVYLVARDSSTTVKTTKPAAPHAGHAAKVASASAK